MSILIKFIILFPLCMSDVLAALTDSTGGTSTFKILQGNDDGWAEGNIRALYEVLKEQGYETIISAPVQNKSGSGSRSKDWEPLDKAGEYDSVPLGAAGVGHDQADDQIWYVNAYPVDGVRYGLDTLTPRFYNGMPDLVISGPNVGTNVAFQDYFSGTIAAAAFAAEQGLPAIAISAADGNRHSYLNRPSDDPSFIYANVTTRILKDLLRVDQKGPYIPKGCVLNINLHKAGPQTSCQSPSDYKFVLTTIFGIKHNSGFNYCGTNFLPGEASIITRKDGCWASVTVIKSGNMLDASSEEKQFVLNRSSEFFSCPENYSGMTEKITLFDSESINILSDDHFAAL